MVILSLTLLQSSNSRSIYLQKYSNENRVALVIGNAKYSRFAPLANTLNDAQDIAKLLKERGFDVINVINGELQSMEKGVKEFAAKLKKGGVGFFYYAGHGLQINDSNYLIPVNSTISNAIDVKYKSLPVNYLIDMMESSRNRLNIIVLDACRNDPFKRGGGGLAQINSAKGMYIAFATGPGEVASDGDERNGLFTKHLLQNIQRSNITLDEVFNQTRKGVHDESNGEQLPWTSTSVIGNFYFNIDTIDSNTTTPAVTPIVTPKPKEIQTVRKATPNLANIFSDEKLKSFLASLLKANAGHDLYGVLDHYGRSVEPYLTTMKANHNDIYQETKAFFTQWSKREYKLDSIQIKRHYEYLNTYYADISYKYHWKRSNKKRQMSGVAIMNATIKSVKDSFKITAIGTISNTTHLDKKLDDEKKQTRTITVDKPIENKEELNDTYRGRSTDYYPYVCYNQRFTEGNPGRITYVKYVGCKRYNRSCKSLGKEHFGKYPNDYRAHKALLRCQSSRPRFVD
jgi:hypothetical protein